MIKIILIVVVVVLVAALLAYAATKLDTFHVQRSANIKAPPEKIFAFIEDLHNWGAWSSWGKMDPAMKRTYSGSANGTGAVYAWEGNNKVGKGRMEITDTSPPSKVTIKLDFIKPFEGHNIAEFLLDPKGDSTNVTWAMHGPTPYMAKVMHVFFNTDKMIGKEFETGLAYLKTIAET
jgi:carbon monoxide dehydrogenase subunit G